MTPEQAYADLEYRLRHPWRGKILAWIRALEERIRG